MTTRVLGSLMTGHTGVVISVMRNGRLAFVQLDGPAGDLPQGIRRWMVHWDDLTELPRQFGKPGLRKRSLEG
ncbi:hypothetical protein [Nonomuraea rubra]|uniref:hypothetical protein n=1 Tax=Nonomuraea rubra TaxID=46180 RepID=UPI0033E8A7E0